MSIEDNDGNSRIELFYRDGEIWYRDYLGMEASTEVQATPRTWKATARATWMGVWDLREHGKATRTAH